MDVDVFALGVFAAIASVVCLALWTEHRSAEEKRQRLEKLRRHL